MLKLLKYWNGFFNFFLFSCLLTADCHQNIIFWKSKKRIVNGFYCSLLLRWGQFIRFSIVRAFLLGKICFSIFDLFTKIYRLSKPKNIFFPLLELFFMGNVVLGWWTFLEQVELNLKCWLRENTAFS